LFGTFSVVSSAVLLELYTEKMLKSVMAVILTLHLRTRKQRNLQKRLDNVTVLMGAREKDPNADTDGSQE